MTPYEVLDLEQSIILSNFIMIKLDKTASLTNLFPKYNTIKKPPLCPFNDLSLFRKAQTIGTMGIFKACSVRLCRK